MRIYEVISAPGRGSRSGILGWFAPMRWLMIGFVASLVALLVAAAGMTRHILIHHAKHRREELTRLEAAPENDLELEP